MNPKVRRKKVVFVVIIGLIITFAFLINGCENRNYSGIIKNPKLPDITKPENLKYCEVDSDCTTSLYVEDSCCLFCENAVNKAGGEYLKVWHNLNCQNPKSSRDCFIFECCEVDDVKCINKTCTLISDCT